MHQLTTPLLLIGAKADYADVRHATGFTAPDPVLFMDASEHRLLLVSMLEYSRAPEALHQMMDAVHRAQSTALKTIRAGVALRKPYQTGADYFERRGFKTEGTNGVTRGFIHRLGHGVGLEIHEKPSLSGRALADCAVPWEV
ncbi:MAG: M24 family metallopeptidase [Kiritimatiellaeota bacterium]|nr:M24 family metallopeptidase [Kiritimatiellota bacterium]